MEIDEILEKQLKPETVVSLRFIDQRRSTGSLDQSTNSVYFDIASASSDDFLNTCRIYRDETVSEALVSPCFCSGTLGRCHVTCLEEWLSKSNKSTCEICGYNFSTVRCPRTFTEWFSKSRSSRERRYLCGDLICFCFLTPLVVASSYLCVQGAWHYLALSHAWTGAGLIVLTAFLWFIFGFWLTVTVRFHQRCWKEWRDRNYVVRILNVDRIREEESESLGSDELLETTV